MPAIRDAVPPCPLLAALAEGGDDALLLAVCGLLREDKGPLRDACTRYKAPLRGRASQRRSEQSGGRAGLLNARYACEAAVAVPRFARRAS